MIQTLARRDDPSLFDRYGLVVVDECHHIPAVSFSTCVRAARTRRWLGLTATPYRRDKLEALIAFQCGPIRHEIESAAVEGTELVRRELIVHHTGTEVTDEETAHIQDVFRVISEDEVRTAQVCGDVNEACTSGRTCLVLTQRIDHIDSIVTAVAALGTNALVLRGGLGKRARQAVSDAIANREHHVELHDYVDSRIPVLDRMHTKRLPAYATLGFDVPKTRRRQRSADPATGSNIDAF